MALESDLVATAQTLVRRPAEVFDAVRECGGHEQVLVRPT